MSLQYLNVKLSLWTYRHICVAVTKRYVKEISGFIGGEDDDGSKIMRTERRILFVTDRPFAKHVID